MPWPLQNQPSRKSTRSAPLVARSTKLALFKYAAALNTASRLEAANKALETKVLASREIVERSELDWWRPMGRVVLRGRRRPVDIFEPAPDFAREDRLALEQAMRLIGENRAAAIDLVGQVVARNPADNALKNLLVRTRELNEEGAYVLG